MFNGERSEVVLNTFLSNELYAFEISTQNSMQ